MDYTNLLRMLKTYEDGYGLYQDAAAAIEALQADVNFYKALAYLWQESTERKERLLGIYRALNMYSAKDPDGRLITNECFNMNRSESPNS